MSIFKDILGVFSAQNAWIKPIPLAEYQAPGDTTLEYPYGGFWDILKIHFLMNWPPWGPFKHIFERN